MPVLGGPAVLGILPEGLTGKHKAPQEAAAAATKEVRDLSRCPAENRRRMKIPEQVKSSAALDKRPSLSRRQATAEVQFEGPTVPAAAAADNHC